MKCAKCGKQKRNRPGYFFNSQTGRVFWICMQCFSKRISHIRADVLSMRKKGLV